MGLSLGTLYSEAAVITTGCGPINIGDSLERVCYICVLIISASSLFVRIVQRTSLTKFVCENYFAESLLRSTVVQVWIAEWLSNIAILEAFVAFFLQALNGRQMDGLSGIDVELCQALRDINN